MPAVGRTAATRNGTGSPSTKASMSSPAFTPRSLAIVSLSTAEPAASSAPAEPSTWSSSAKATAAPGSTSRTRTSGSTRRSALSTETPSTETPSTETPSTEVLATATSKRVTPSVPSISSSAFSPAAMVASVGSIIDGSGTITSSSTGPNRSTARLRMERPNESPMMNDAVMSAVASRAPPMTRAASPGRRLTLRRARRRMVGRAARSKTTSGRRTARMAIAMVVIGPDHNHRAPGRWHGACHRRSVHR